MDGPFYTQRGDASARSAPHSGERVWELDSSGSRMSAEVRWTPRGWELRLFLDGHPRYTHRNATRSQALDDAASCLRQFEASGWSMLGTNPLREMGTIEHSARVVTQVENAVTKSRRRTGTGRPRRAQDA